MKRAKWKGPYCNSDLFYSIINKPFNQIIYTKSRSSTILPQFVQHKIGVHTGNDYKVITVSSDMIGHKLGEFAPTKISPRFKVKAKR